MIAPNEQIAGRSLKITSIEALDAAIARVVTLKISHTAARAVADKEIAEVEKRHTDKLTAIIDNIAVAEEEIRDYCDAHRSELFADKKSGDYPLATLNKECENQTKK